MPLLKRWKLVACILALGVMQNNAVLAAPSAPGVRDVAATPAAYVGKLTLSGVVGVVTPGKGFVLVDSWEYQAEGFNCLNTAELIKVPVVWPGPRRK